MPSTKNVQITHMSQKIRDLHGSLIDLMSFMNQPQRDAALVREAGIALDRALFPLLVGIERRGPIGIVDLAAGVGRDYSTVSRQVAKLESLGLAERRQSATDRRVTEAVITAKGKAMTDKIDAARERIAQAVFATWEADEVDEFVRLMRKFADAMSVQ
ncbi:winged helix-turn-helix transcriptional regulator (plasmid) [Agrobacterium pusense]|uniref:MarR family winged helix-turn-helix transcriptional regulator n=1 Tax=Agrobacterium pusense TaxID=648995 RepID=UPI0010BF52FC|nr:MarR family winged helix-turn-helix transcriptional regulator [Agrobacterium pusense]MDH0117931.1 MarR family winged helix-turn-helix transcriptional regulator [Agrobacterium pusense]QCL87574.1 winged helix-turn-helix transcriptional regulator [Agrobacterium pusense]